MSQEARPLTKGERTRSTILRHAAASFRRSGYDATTVASIAQEIGISDATVFQHFGTKSGLLGAVMEEFYAGMYTTALDIANSPGDAQVRFRQLIDAWALRAERDWDLIRVFTQRARYSTDIELDTQWKGLNRRYTRIHIDLILELQEQGILNDQVPASLIRDIVFGAIEHIALRPDSSGRIEVRHRAKQVIDALVAHRVSDLEIKGRLDRIDAKLDAALGRTESSEGSDRSRGDGKVGDLAVEHPN